MKRISVLAIAFWLLVAAFIVSIPLTFLRMAWDVAESNIKFLDKIFTASCKEETKKEKPE